MTDSYFSLLCCLSQLMAHFPIDSGVCKENTETGIQGIFVGGLKFRLTFVAFSAVIICFVLSVSCDGLQYEISGQLFEAVYLLSKFSLAALRVSTLFNKLLHINSLTIATEEINRVF